MTVKLDYIQWRDGRPKFKPDGRTRKLGFAGQDLRHPNNGPWFTYEEARAWIWGESGYRDGKGGVYGQIVAARKRGRPVTGTLRANARDHTVEALILDWMRALQNDRSSDRLSENTLDSYVKDSNALIYRPETRAEARMRRAKNALFDDPNAGRLKEPFAKMEVRLIGVPELNEHYLYLKRVRGHHMALHAISAFSAAWTWGQKSTKWRLGINPRHHLDLAQPKGRIVLVAAEEIAAMVAANDALGRPSIGDAILLGLFTGQRQNDRLALTDGGVLDGRRVFRQSKTKMIVHIKEAPRLTERLRAAADRRAKLAERRGVLTPAIVADESTGAEYESNTYRHRFADGRAVAIHGWRLDETREQAIARGEKANADWGKGIKPDFSYPGPWRLPPCPSLGMNEDGEYDPKRDQDLRDTCVTLLYRAGCTLLEICDITGHSYAAAKTIVNHYLARDPQRADVAIDKLVAFMQQKGMVV